MLLLRGLQRQRWALARRRALAAGAAAAEAPAGAATAAGGGGAAPGGAAPGGAGPADAGGSGAPCGSAASGGGDGPGSGGSGSAVTKRPPADPFQGMWYEWWPFDPKPEPVTTNAFLLRTDPRKFYFWCACGRSLNQPFCDGSHKGTGIRPFVFSGNISRLHLYCGCKHSYQNCPSCWGYCLQIKMNQMWPWSIINVYLVCFSIALISNYFWHP